jgi:hypothetical protein
MIQLWPTFTPVQSVAPSLIVVTLPGNEFLEPVPPVTTGITSTTKILPPLFSVSQTLTIEPQPTYPTITLPENLSITWSSGPPGPTCLGNRGHRSYILLPPSLCGGTCGIFGCGTGCGLSGCGVGCPECDSKPSGGEGANDSPPPPHQHHHRNPQRLRKSLQRQQLPPPAVRQELRLIVTQFAMSWIAAVTHLASPLPMPAQQPWRRHSQSRHPQSSSTSMNPMTRLVLMLAISLRL